MAGRGGDAGEGEWAGRPARQRCRRERTQFSRFQPRKVRSIQLYRKRRDGQGYEPDVAAVLGVFLHGVAGDKAAEYYGMEGMNSADLIDFLAEALKETE